MANIDYKLLSPLDKCFHDSKLDEFAEYKKGSALRGERFSFQLAWRDDVEIIDAKDAVFLSIESELTCIEPKSVETVPVRVPCYNIRRDANYLRTTPGLYPDMLLPITEKSELYIAYQDTRAVWIDVMVPEDAKAGTYPIKLTLTRWDKSVAATATFNLTIIPATLPKQTLIHTEWFYTDCIADYYQVTPWSEEHWRLVENYVKTAVKCGINMILTPVFTPALDTAIGGERTTVQLLKVTQTKGKWSFDFSLLERWIDMCLANGIEYFEICHMFTQWGAKNAPKIMATVDGEYKRVFGWETDAMGEEYRNFIDCMLPALVDFFKKKGVDKKCAFHVSDEPSLESLDHYMECKNIIAKHLEGYTIMDALSNYEFYKSGACACPIPSNDHIEKFIEEKVPNLWTYYCCGQSIDVSNRMISMPGARTRIIGYQLFKFDIKGFLQWGFNFYNSQNSVEKINPYHTTDGKYMVPAGDTFAVYPAPDGTTYDTIHYQLFYQGLQDMRALQLAESLFGKKKVMNVLEKDLEEKITFSKYPHSSEYLLSTREKINSMIAKEMAK